MSTITYPHPYHLNGSGAKNLIEQHRDALDALHHAIGTIIEATPHPRDWQGDTTDNYNAAVAVSRARVLVLEYIREDITAGLHLIIDGDK